MLDPKKIRDDFPVFSHHSNLIYLDSAATSLKPRSVIEKEREYMEEYPANIARGLYAISERATEEYEKTRESVAHFIGARKEEIIFTKGATESLNLLSYSLQEHISKENNIVVTAMDHHANFLPWQALAKRIGAEFRVIPISENGKIDMHTLDSFIDKKTKVFAFPYISNVLGSIAPVQNIAEKVRLLSPNANIILDATQAAPHMTIDKKILGVDFLTFSAHKCFGPTGVGVLWGKYEILETLPPFQYGGEMVESARIENSVFKKPPHRFEAGTPNISGVIAFRSAIEYIQSMGMENIRSHEELLIDYTLTQLQEKFHDIRIFGSKEKHGSIISFVFPDIHPHDLAETLAQENICVRAGTHCAHPIHATLGINATARISFSIYNSKEDIDHAIESIKKARKLYTL